jgi:hypothetical protein
MNNQNENAVENKKDKKIYKALERVTIEDNLKNKLNLLTASANESLQGIAEVSKSDVVNLILKLHPDELSKTETDELRKIHFDVFKCLAWLQTKAKDAKEKGTEVSLKELFEKSSEFMVDASDSSSKKLRKTRKSKAVEDNGELNSPPSELKSNTSK